MIPLPRLRINGLPDGPEDFQAAACVLGDVMVSFSHEGADGGGRGVEVRDAVLVDDVPEPANWGGGREGRRKGR